VRTTLAALLGGAALAWAAFAQDGGDVPAERGTLYFFFADDTPRLVETARAAKAAGVPVRAVYLARNLRELHPVLEHAVDELGPFLLADEEGLNLARRLGIRRTPAYAWIDVNGRAHVATGTKVSLKELITCSP
jgi:hypothetical protein